MRLPDDSPLSSIGQPRRLDSVSSLRIRGRGKVVLELNGTGRVTLKRGRFDDFSFEGRGLPRHVSAQCVRMDGPHGRLILEGDELELDFSGGVASAELTGSFEVELRGLDWGPHMPQGRREPATWRARSARRYKRYGEVT